VPPRPGSCGACAGRAFATAWWWTLDAAAASGRALTDAGYDVLGVDVSEAMLQIAQRARLQTTGRSFFQGEDWLLCNDVSGEGQTLTRRITTFTRDRRAWRRAHEEHTLTLYTADDVLAALDDAGFEARRLRSYGRELPPPRGLAFFAATRR
jgi:hypothetical protein